MAKKGIANFGGKKAAPFKAGGKPRAPGTAAPETMADAEKARRKAKGGGKSKGKKSEPTPGRHG